MKIENGIHTDISITDYHANRTHYSSTGIKYAKSSLLHFKCFLDGGMEKEGAHFDFGNAFELALLDKKGFENEVAISQTEYWEAEALKEKPKLKVPKNSTKYKEQLEQFLKENKGKYIIPDIGNQSYGTIEKMLESCYKDDAIRQLIKGTEYQLSLFWTDEETGLNLKTRPDICKVKKNVVINLKTALDGSPRAFSRDLVKYDYPMQACLEIKGCVDSGLMSTVDNYFWLVVEKTPPFNATIYEFDAADISACTDELNYYLNRIAEAKETDKWTGYSAAADNPYGILQAFVPQYYNKIN